MKRFVLILLCISLSFCAFGVSAYAEDDLYLSDIRNKMTSYSGLDNLIGYDTSHAGDYIKIGSTKLDKGLGIHCNPTDPTYIEFDIADYSYNYLKAQIGMQSYSSQGVFLDWGSAIFMVYGDGKLLYTSEVQNYGSEPTLAVVDITGVKRLRLENSNAGGYSCDWCIWGDIKMSNDKSGVEITTEKPVATADFEQTDAVKASDFAYISDMVWGEYHNYGGNPPIKDGNHYNEEIWCNDIFHAKGVGMHCDAGGSFLEINLNGCAFTTFYALCMISDSFSPHDISMASVRFAVYGDGVELFSTETVRPDGKVAKIQVDITGVKVLKLYADPTSDGISGDWATWADASVCKGEPSQYNTETTIDETTAPESSGDSETSGITDSDTTTAVSEPDTENRTTAYIVIGCCVAVALIIPISIFAFRRKKQ